MLIEAAPLLLLFEFSLVLARAFGRPPGEEAQIDYGYLGSWTDPVGGRTRRIWALPVSATRNPPSGVAAT